MANGLATSFRFLAETCLALIAHAAIDYDLQNPLPGIAFIILWGYYEATQHVFPYRPPNDAYREILKYRVRGWLLVCWIYFASTFARMHLLKLCLENASSNRLHKSSCKWTTSILSLPNEKLRQQYKPWDFMTE